MVAEKTLQEFRSSPQPYDACKYILENSKDTAAQFQAVTALRDASIREWDTVLNGETRFALIQYLMSMCVQDRADMSAVVIRQLGACAGTLMKRIWGDLNSNDKESILGQIAQITSEQQSSPVAKCRAVELMVAVIVEFNPETAGEMGLPWEYHYQCKNDLEKNFLPKILNWALACAQSTHKLAVLGQDMGLCSASLSLLSALLAWDSSQNENRMRRRDINMQVRPPESWREALLGQPGYGWRLEFLNDLVSAFCRSSALRESPIMFTFLQLTNNLALMQGAIFLDEGRRASLGLGPSSMSSSVGHIRHLLKLCLPILMQLEGNIASISSYVSANRDLVLGMCRIFALVATTHPLKKFAEALMEDNIDLPDGNLMLINLGSITNAMVYDIQRGNDACEECLELLVEMWTEYSSDFDLHGHLGPLYEQFCQCTSSVFNALKDKELYEVSRDVYSDEQDYEGDEEAYSDSLFSGLAAIGRSSCQYSIPALIESFETSIHHLQQSVSNGSDPSVPLEKICWLLRMISFVLADSGDGETPQVPQNLIDTILRHNLRENAVIKVSSSMIMFGMDVKGAIESGIASSRLVEELCKALGRWSETYLLPDCKDAAPGLDWTEFVFSSNKEGTPIVNLFCELALLSLPKYPGDRALHLAICHNLLKPLVKYKGLRTVVSQCSAWKNLIHLYVSESTEMKLLDAEVHFEIANLICTCYSTSTDNQAMQYIRDLVAWHGNKLISSASMKKDAFNRPENISYTVNALSGFRGAARCSSSTCHEIIMLGMSQCFPAILQILKQSKEHRNIYNTILDLAADIVEYHSAFLNDSSSMHLFTWAIEIIQVHSSDKINFSIKSAGLVGDHFEDECEALVSLIRLLTQITGAETCRHEDIVAAVLTGIQAIIPLLTVEHLKLPPLRQSFFHLLAYMMEVYASHVAKLPPDSFISFLQAIAFGLKVEDDSETSSAVFEAVAAFSKFSLSSRLHGDVAGMSENILIEGKHALVFLYDIILARIVFEDAGVGSIDLASEPVLYIMAHDAAFYSEYIRHKSLHAVQNQQSQEQISSACDDLKSCVLQNASVDRNARQRFLPVFRSCIIKIRRVVRTQ